MAQQTALGEASQLASEFFSGIKTVKAFNQEKFTSTRYNKSVDSVLEAGLARVSISSLFSSLINFLLHSSIIIVLILGIQLVIDSKLPLEDLAAFLLYGLIVAVSFTFLLGGYSDLAEALGVGDRIFKLLDSDFDSSSTIDSNNLTPTKPPNIEFENVNFSYPTRPEVSSIKDFSLQIPVGKIAALVGPTGAGKSTILQLLLGLYEPSDGKILWDDTELRQINKGELRTKIGFVPQEPTLFNASVRENILFGNPEASEEELNNVINAVNLSKVLDKLPDGVNSNVGDSGKLLSGGQRQLVAIARALLRNPALVLLDEPTSALDSESERLVLEAINELLEGRTALIVAHRLSTVKNANMIAVLENGRIIQTGTHEELAKIPGLYKTYIEHQSLDIDSNVVAR